MVQNMTLLNLTNSSSNSLSTFLTPYNLIQYLFCFAGLICNFLLFIVITKSNRLRSVHYKFLRNLLVAYSLGMVKIINIQTFGVRFLA